MPNGFTAPIYEGREDFTLRDYLMGVGRGMGFAIMQRGEDPSSPIKYVEPSTYYDDEQIRKAQATLAELDGMTIEEAGARLAAERAAADERRRDSVQKTLAMRARYERMIRGVEAWDPVPLMDSTKEQALKYLRESMEFDCGRPGEEARFLDHQTAFDGAEWLTQERRRAQEQITRSREHIAAERKRTAERNRYIDAFYESLPPIPTGRTDA